MPSLQVRDLPEAIYQKLVERAKREHRSLSQQATVLLASALDASLRPKERRERLLKEISEQPPRPGSEGLRPPEPLIREDRER